MRATSLDTKTDKKTLTIHVFRVIAQLQLGQRLSPGLALLLGEDQRVEGEPGNGLISHCLSQCLFSAVSWILDPVASNPPYTFPLMDRLFWGQYN